MNSSAAFDVKGWCPGALRPMQSGDGLVVRIRPRSGVEPHELRVLADAARRFGNGHIDLTRRAICSSGVSAKLRCRRCMTRSQNSDFSTTARTVRPCAM